MKVDIVNRWHEMASQLRSVLRLFASFTFMLHGTSKLFAFPAGSGKGGTVQLISEIGLAGVLEAFGGGLLFIGLFTRPVALLLSGEMAVAFFQVHFPRSFWPTVGGGELALIYCFLWLYFSAAGAGTWSVDAFIDRNRSKTHS